MEQFLFRFEISKKHEIRRKKKKEKKSGKSGKSDISADLFTHLSILETGGKWRRKRAGTR